MITAAAGASDLSAGDDVTVLDDHCVAATAAYITSARGASAPEKEQS
jgi:hypothetical protein